MNDKIIVDQDPQVNWENDHLQFARLIAELQGIGIPNYQQLRELAASMDLRVTQVMDIVDRASDAWDAVKEST